MTRALSIKMATVKKGGESRRNNERRLERRESEVERIRTVEEAEPCSAKLLIAQRCASKGTEETKGVRRLGQILHSPQPRPPVPALLRLL